jgi:pre-mRNA cleavage complex 2 protein Pcf11
MFFDKDDGEWKYRNCKEMNVKDDGPMMDIEELEPVLVHFTCWEGLGSPRFLMPDQIRHAA